MAVDLQVTFAQEAVQLDKIRLVTVGGLKTLRITGHDFRAVDEVTINDAPSPDVVIVSRNELLAQLPDIMQKVPEVRRVVVLNNRFSVSAKSLIRFRIGKTPGKVRGLMRLVQLFLKLLFTTPGTDIFNQNMGGGALSRIGSTYGKDEGDNIHTEFVIAVNRAQRQMVAMQSLDQRSPRDERLLAANVVGSQFDKTSGTLYMTVELVSQAGRSAITNVEL